MTSPQGTVLEATIAELLRHAKQLGLVWGFRPATVTNTVDPFDPLDCEVRYDGDIDSIPMTSLIGPVWTNERVMVLYVPPNGNYVIGRSNEFGTVLDTYHAPQAGTYYNGTAEANLAHPTFTDPFVEVSGRLLAGRRYMLTCGGPAKSAVGATEPFVVKYFARRTDTNALVGEKQENIPADLFDMSVHFNSMLTPSVDENVTIRLSAARTAGGGANAQVVVTAGVTSPVYMLLRDVTPGHGILNPTA